MKQENRIDEVDLLRGLAAILMILAKAFGGLFVNGTEPLGEGIFKLLFMGGGYWFLYVNG